LIVQLKASDSLVQLLSRVRRVNTIVLCEGSRDAEVFKAVARRLGFTERLGDVAVTDAEGVNTLRRDLLPTLVALIAGKVVSRPKPIAVIVDSDRFKAEERAKALVDALRSRGYTATELQQVCSSTWRTNVGHQQREQASTPLLVTVNGIFEHPFNNLEAHELEDHIAYLKMLEGMLKPEDIVGVRRASSLVTVDDYRLLEAASLESLRAAFKHVVCLLNTLARQGQ
jgi:hypothetical protein